MKSQIYLPSFRITMVPLEISPPSIPQWILLWLDQKTTIVLFCGTISIYMWKKICHKPMMLLKLLTSLKMGRKSWPLMLLEKLGFTVKNTTISHFSMIFNWNKPSLQIASVIQPMPMQVLYQMTTRKCSLEKQAEMCSSICGMGVNSTINRLLTIWQDPLAPFLWRGKKWRSLKMEPLWKSMTSLPADTV